MIRTMIADLDIDNVNSFRSFIKKNFSDIKLLKSAVIPSELYKNILEYKPELIIMEMRFFGNKAMSSITSLIEEYPEIKLIIYGNPNEGEYMKKLSEAGIIAYIYRPVRPSELKRALNEAIKIFDVLKENDEQQKIIYKEYHEQLLVFETKFFDTLISGRLTNEIEISEGLEYFDVKILPPYRICNIRIDHFKKIVLTLDEMEKHILIFNILKKVNELIENGKAFIHSFNEIVVILGESPELEDCVNKFTEIKEEIHTLTNIGVSVGIGKAHDSLRDIQTSFNEAEAALRYRCIMGYGSVTAIEYTEPDNNITYSYPSEREETLVFTAIMGDYDYCCKILNELFNALEVPEISVSANMLQQLVMNILISISRHSAEQHLNIASINKFFPTADIFNITTTAQAHQVLEYGLRDFCEYMKNLHLGKEEELVHKATDYIKDHYCETITSASISRELGCSAEYLKKIFASEFKKPLPEYIAKLRIERAKELILTTTLSDDIIGINVGYDDLLKFRSVFKQVEGYTIGDFRYIKNRRIGKI